MSRMNDKSGNLPFWGKQKPLKHYFENGVITFTVSKPNLYYSVTKITKLGRFSLYSGRVRDKQHLDGLLKSKNLEQLSHLE